MNGCTAQVGIVGTGYIAQGVLRAIGKTTDLCVSRILTRRPLHEVHNLPAELLTDSIDDLVSHCDVVLECSGDVIHATLVVNCHH